MLLGAAPAQPNHPSHVFGGIDGRCFNCDVRPFSIHSPEPCDGL